MFFDEDGDLAHEFYEEVAPRYDIFFIAITVILRLSLSAVEPYGSNLHIGTVLGEFFHLCAAYYENANLFYVICNKLTVLRVSSNFKKFNPGTAFFYYLSLSLSPIFFPVVKNPVPVRGTS
jgi:Tumour suppressor candidate 2